MPWKYIGAGVGVLIILIGIALFFRNVEKGQIREENNLRNQGQSEERVKSNEETFNAIQNANRPVTRDELNVVCGKYDRNCNSVSP